jgi:Ssp1 endopeptidase immunity protein Rap1a
MRHLVAALAVLFVWAMEARAEPSVNVSAYFTGIKLSGFCKAYLRTSQSGRIFGSDTYGTAMCHGYVVGALDTIMFSEALENRDNTQSNVAHQFCMPGNTDQVAAVEIVAQYIAAHPEEWSGAGYLLVRNALVKKFPCK